VSGLSRRELARKKAVIAAKLRQGSPIWEGSGLKLYLDDNGFYVVHRASPEDFIGISPDGVLEDLVGFPVESSDYENALRALRGASHEEMRDKVKARYESRGW